MKETTLNKIQENNKVIANVFRIARDRYGMEIGTYVPDSKFAAVHDAKGHMAVKLCINNTTVRLCFRETEELKAFPGMQYVNYSLPCQYVIKYDTPDKYNLISKLLKMGIGAHTEYYSAKAEKKAEKKAKKAEADASAEVTA